MGDNTKSGDTIIDSIDIDSVNISGGYILWRATLNLGQQRCLDPMDYSGIIPLVNEGYNQLDGLLQELFVTCSGYFMGFFFVYGNVNHPVLWVLCCSTRGYSLMGIYIYA